MTLRRKIMLSILVTTMVLFSLLYLLSDYTLLSNYKRMENSRLEESMRQTLLAYYDEFTSLGAIAINYAGWDDTYAFINRTPRPSETDPYLTSNYPDSLFASSRLNFALLLNSDGAVYFSKAYDYFSKTPLTGSLDLVRTLQTGHASFLEHPDVFSRKEGLIVAGGRAMIAASYPILNSNNQGPVRGTLLFARFLDDRYARFISDRSGIPWTIQPVGPTYEAPPDAEPVSLLSDQNAVFWTRFNASDGTGFCLLRDVGNRPALLLQFSKPRELYHEARKDLLFYMLYFALTGLVFYLILHFLMKKVLFNRLQRTVDGMNTIKARQDFSFRLAVTGNDELTRMENSFNHMMGSLEIAQDEIQYQADHDALTLLPNRKSFYRHMEELLQRNERESLRFAVLFIDLDRFKLINDTMGHRAGDLLLTEAAERLRHCIQEEDFLCRMGGDEFCVIAMKAEAQRAEHLAQTIKETLETPFNLEGRRTAISSCIGISLFPDHGFDAESLLHYSDTAMLEAKETGKNHFRMYTELQDAARLRRLKVEQYLSNAIDNRELSLQYQPKWDLGNNRISGVEALLRWNNPELGAVSPLEFIPVSESSGLINGIGEWIIRTACRQYAAWQSRHPGMSLIVAINISGVQLLQPDFVERIRLLFMEENANPGTFELEVTESFAIQKFEEVQDIFLRLRELGFLISIDDFGAGYSSMKYLCQLPVQCMKIDKTLIDPLEINPRSQVIVSALIDMARQLDMTVVAEGVEKQEQLQILRSYSCDQIQGYLISRPVQPDAIDRLLGEQQPEAG